MLVNEEDEILEEGTDGEGGLWCGRGTGCV